MLLEGFQIRVILPHPIANQLGPNVLVNANEEYSSETLLADVWEMHRAESEVSGEVADAEISLSR